MGYERDDASPCSEGKPPKAVRQAFCSPGHTDAAACDPIEGGDVRCSATRVADFVAMTEENPKLQAQYDELRTHVVETRDAAILQEVGVYEYRHPPTDAPAYKGQLATISDQIKTAVQSRRAVTGSTTWTVTDRRPRETEWSESSQS